MDAEGVLYHYIMDKEPNFWGIRFSRTEFHSKFIIKDAADGSRHTLVMPTKLVSNEGFVMFLYNSETDVLLKCGLPWKQKFSLVLWAVLNHKLFLNSAKGDANLKFGYGKNNGNHSLKKVKCLKK